MARRMGSPVWVLAGVAIALGNQAPVAVPFALVGTSTGNRAIYEPLTPARILDTRVAGQGPALQAQTPRTLVVVGKGGVPADATAVVVNATIVKPNIAGYLAVWPTGQTRPTVSNVNYAASQTIANLVTVTLGAGGAVDMFIPNGMAHVIIDVAGYYRAHDHDDRYLTKAATQARTAENPLSCPSTSAIKSVAPDGTTTCLPVQGRTAAGALTCPAGSVIESVLPDGQPTCVANAQVSPFFGLPTGNLAVNGGATFTLGTDVYFQDANLAPNSHIKLNGYRLFVRGTLTLNEGATINRDGNPGTLGAAGAALASATVGGGGAGACGTATGITNALGGTGNNGASGVASVTRPALAVGGASIFRTITQALLGRTLDGEVVLGGAGGGGGACTGTAPGGGGSGGGVAIVAAARIVVSGTSARISADGGSSAAGGGGGGGTVVVVTQNPLPAGLVVRAAAGTTGGSSPWGAGQAGSTFVYVL